jgi:hypothetical protein
VNKKAVISSAWYFSGAASFNRDISSWDVNKKALISSTCSTVVERVLELSSICSHANWKHLGISLLIDVAMFYGRGQLQLE